MILTNKKINIKFTYLLITIIFILFTSIYHFKHARSALNFDNTQTNIILFHESEPIQNYISTGIENNNSNQIIVWKDLLSTFFIPNNNLNLKVVLLENLNFFLYNNIKNCSILNRYKTRVLRL